MDNDIFLDQVYQDLNSADLAKYDSLFKDMHLILCGVNGLPKLNVAAKTYLKNMSIILYYIFSLNIHGF